MTSTIVQKIISMISIPRADNIGTTKKDYQVKFRDVVWTDDQINERLRKVHEQENEYNREMGKISAQIYHLEHKKKKLQQMISSNMKYSNLILGFKNNN